MSGTEHRQRGELKRNREMLSDLHWQHLPLIFFFCVVTVVSLFCGRIVMIWATGIQDAVGGRENDESGVWLQKKGG